MKYIDLHIHSTASEGNLTPKQIIKEVKKYDIEAIALADHDTIDGVEEAMYWGKKLGVRVIPGVEIYTQYKKFNPHLLGYGFDLKHSGLNKLLKNLQEKHLKDVKNTIEKLNKTGFEIDNDKVFNTPSKYIGLGQIIEVLSQNTKNLIKIKKDIGKDEPTFFEIISQYFTKKRSAHLPEAAASFKKAIEAIKAAGGFPVLAHPGQQLTWDDDDIIFELKKLGIKGLEVITPYHSWHQIEHYQQIAIDLNLAITGGTDLHASQILPKGPIKNQWSYFKVPYEIYNNLRKNLK